MILKVNETETITVTVSPSNATDKRVTFSSSDNNIATIDENGKVTALAGGKATITVTSVADNSKKATVNVVVGDILIPATFADDPTLGTIQNEIDKADEESTIVVMPAAYPKTYNEQLVINKSLTLLGLNTALNGTITITADNVTVDGFNVVAPSDYTLPVIHIIDSDGVNIINNTVFSQGYASIGTSSGPARVTGKISGNKVTGMIIVGTDGELEVSDNDVTLTPTSTEGICFYPVVSTAEITVTGNTVGAVTAGNVQILVDEKPTSVNEKTTEAEMLAAISADNNGATAKLGWVKTVGETGADFTNIQDAIDGATTGDNIIAVYPGDYGTDFIDIIQQDGVNITLEAVGEVVLKNQIRIDGNARLAGEETLTIKGFTFDFSDIVEIEDMIVTSHIVPTNNYVYAHNVSVIDVTFIGNPQVNHVAFRAPAQGGHNDFHLKGCTGKDLFSLVQFTSVSGVKVEDCNVINAAEGGLNLNSSRDIEIKNLTVEASMIGNSYGVRAGQGSGTVNESNTMTISDSNLEAKYPVWLRGDAPGTVIITGSTLTANEEGQEIRNDAGENVTILRDPPVYNENLKTYYMTIQDAIAAYENAENGDYTIIIQDGTYNVDSIVINQQNDKPLTIKAENDLKAIFVNANETDGTGIFHISGRSSFDTGAVTFEGIRFELPAGANVNCFGIKLLSGTEDRYASNVTVRNCEFIGSVEKSCAVYSASHSSPKDILIEGCKGDGLTALYNGYGSGITIKDSELTNARGLLNSQSTDSTNKLVIDNVEATIDYEPSKDMDAIKINGGHLTVEDSNITLNYNGANRESGLIVIRGEATIAINNSTLTTNKVGGNYDVYTFYGISPASIVNIVFTSVPEGSTYGGTFKELPSQL